MEEAGSSNLPKPIPYLTELVFSAVFVQDLGTTIACNIRRCVSINDSPMRSLVNESQATII